MAFYQEASFFWYFLFLLTDNSGWAYAWCSGNILLTSSAHMQLMDSLGSVACPLVTSVWQWIQMSQGKNFRSGNSHSFIMFSLILIILNPLQHLPELLGPSGILVSYGDPSQPDIELRRSAVHCTANLCLRWAMSSVQSCLESNLRKWLLFNIFLKCRSLTKGWNTLCSFCPNLCPDFEQLRKLKGQSQSVDFGQSDSSDFTESFLMYDGH